MSFYRKGALGKICTIPSVSSKVIWKSQVETLWEKSIWLSCHRSCLKIQTKPCCSWMRQSHLSSGRFFACLHLFSILKTNRVRAKKSLFHSIKRHHSTLRLPLRLSQSVHKMNFGVEKHFGWGWNVLSYLFSELVKLNGKVFLGSEWFGATLQE